MKRKHIFIIYGMIMQLLHSSCIITAQTNDADAAVAPSHADKQIKAETDSKPVDLKAEVDKMSKLVSEAKLRLEELQSLINIKANSTSPNEMNSTKGDPMYRVPGSSGDRLVITPEIKSKLAKLMDELKRIRRNARKLQAVADPPLEELLSVENDARKLADDALKLHNHVTGL